MSVSAATAIEHVSLGAAHACARSSQGTLCWGANSEEQLGLNGAGAAQELTPTEVPDAPAGGFVGLALGEEHSCGRTQTPPQVWCWGRNVNGELGIDTVLGAGARLPSPTLVEDLPAGALNDLAAGKQHTCAVLADTVWCWGRNDARQLGSTSTVSASGFPIMTNLDNVQRVVAGEQHGCALRGTGAVWCWGQNDAGQLGRGVVGAPQTPAAIAGDRRYIDLSAGANHTCAISESRELYCWGRNAQGQLGQGTRGEYIEQPVLVPLDSTIKVATGAEHTCALSPDGTVRCFGDGSFGQLANTALLSESSPVRSGLSCDIL